MMRKTPLALLLAGCFMSGTVSAMTLADAHALALAQDAKLASAQARLEADSEQVPQARSQLLPQVSASVSSKQENYVLPGRATNFDERTSNQNLQVTQPVYARKAWHALDQAELKVDYARLRLDSAQVELGLRVSEAYLNILLAQENLALSQQQVDTTQSRLKQVEEALKVGYASKVDVFSLKAELDDARARQIADEQQLKFFRQKLKVLIGQEPPDHLPWPKLDAAQLHQRFVQGRDWLEEARNRNLDVQMSQVGLSVAQQEVEVRKSDHYPTVNLGAYYSDAQGSTYFAQKNDNKVLYLELKMPLYQGGYVSSRVREGEALLRSAEQDARFAEREAQKLAQEQLSNFASAQERLEALKQAVSSGEAYLASVEEGYRLGLRDIAEVSRAKEKLFANKRDRVRSSMDAINALMQLYALTGQLDAGQVGQISQVLWVK